MTAAEENPAPAVEKEPRMVTLYEPGDLVWTIASGRPRAFHVLQDGSLFELSVQEAAALL